VDLLATLFGRIGWLLILYCVFFGTLGVFLRYALNDPSLWIGNTLQAAMVVMACVGGAYALNQDAFVKVDVFYDRLSARGKAVSDLVTVVYVFMYLGVLIWKGIEQAQTSIMLGQTTPTAIPMPIYPFKAIIPMAAAVVVIVVLKKVIQDVATIGGTPRWSRR
jgi:TRAP-type mannitol/chloroaromatic compound transport system permease small subunit